MRGGTNEPDDAALHIGQKHILLCLVEAMNFVNEQQCRAAGVFEAVGRAAEDAAHLGDITFHATKTFKLTFSSIGDDLRKRSFTGAGRAIKDQRLNTIGLNGAPQQHPGFEDVLLPCVFFESARTHSGCERRLPLPGLAIGFRCIGFRIRFVAE